MKLIQFFASLAWVTIVLGAAGCSKHSPQDSVIESALRPLIGTRAKVPEVTGPELTSLATPVERAKVTIGVNGQHSATPDATKVTLSNGAEISLISVQGKFFFEVEATLSDEDYSRIKSNFARVSEAERTARLSREVDNLLGKLQSSQVLETGRSASFGYVTFLLPYQSDLMSPLKQLRFGSRWLAAPVTTDLSDIRNAKEQKMDVRSVNTAFSGLDRIHVPAFLAKVRNDLPAGVNVDGSSTTLGITDTGITYNHPSFVGALSGKPRITYMKDFTREGRVYFSKEAKFQAVAGSTANGEQEGGDLKISGQVIVTPKLPAIPPADRFTEISGLTIKVGAELKNKILSNPGGAHLGVLLEKVFQSDEDKVDINHNGEIDDKIWMILIEGASPGQEQVYVDFSGTGDFRGVPPLGDFNQTGDLVPVFAEKIGFHIQREKLPSASGTGTKEVWSASLVGYDPGNHGTHVAGIASGTRTLSNDGSGTMARGVAPEAQILMNRVCSNNAGCGATRAMLDFGERGGVDVVNMSLGGLSPFNDGYGVQETIVNRLAVEKNILFVISAGNSGPGRETVGSPSTARLSLSVAATAHPDMIRRQRNWPANGNISTGSESNKSPDDFVFFFSSRGPTAAGGFKPSISAPGVELSAVQLNGAPGGRSGLDVYWGTSMAAPTASGAALLLLDAARKYNLAHPNAVLPTDVRTIKQVLMSSARSFDVSKKDWSTGEYQQGRYTWIDQGAGMIDLDAAWDMLKLVQRQDVIPTGVNLNGTPVDLDYTVLTSQKSLAGQSYDGSRMAEDKGPAFGTGVVFDFEARDTLRQVFIQRGLPTSLSTGSQAGELSRLLETSSENFELKVVQYGSDVEWIKAGVFNQLDCWDSSASDLTLVGRGAELAVEDGRGKINAFDVSTLNVCVNRDVIREKLSPGDHGALIYAFRKSGSNLSTLPSFVVPVYLTVPHKRLAQSTRYEVRGEVGSFGVSRNYVNIPSGATRVGVQLEVDEAKSAKDCAGVELMGNPGEHTAKYFQSRAKARVSNCTPQGEPILDSSKRILRYFTTAPKSGIWDLHIFGSYIFPKSGFKLSVDFIAAKSMPEILAGTPTSISGKEINLTLLEASSPVEVSETNSSFSLMGLRSAQRLQAKSDSSIFVPSVDGGLAHRYPTEVKTVVFETGGSTGNDIDLVVFGCDSNAADAQDASCEKVGQSGGSTDEEKIELNPNVGKTYFVRVDGYSINADPGFDAKETLFHSTEKADILVRSSGSGAYGLRVNLTEDWIAKSKILSGLLFQTKNWTAWGEAAVVGKDSSLIHAIPVEIRP